MVFSPDGQLVASGSDDSTVRLWDAGDGRAARHARGPLQLGQHGGVLAGRAAGGLGVRRQHGAAVGRGDGRARGTLEGHSGWVSTVVFSPDGQLVASGSNDSTVRLWDAATGEARGTLEGHSGWVHAVGILAGRAASGLSGGRQDGAVVGHRAERDRSHY